MRKPSEIGEKPTDYESGAGSAQSRLPVGLPKWKTWLKRIVIGVVFLLVARVAWSFCRGDDSQKGKTDARQVAEPEITQRGSPINESTKPDRRIEPDAPRVVWVAPDSCGIAVGGGVRRLHSGLVVGGWRLLRVREGGVVLGHVSGTVREARADPRTADIERGGPPGRSGESSDRRRGGDGWTFWDWGGPSGRSRNVGESVGRSGG